MTDTLAISATLVQMRPFELVKAADAGQKAFGMRYLQRLLGCGEVLLLVAALSFRPAFASAQNADGRLMAMSCAGCHGPGGHSPGTIPSLYGRDAAAIAEALRSFRADQRPSTVMGRIAKGYSDAEIDAVARDVAASWK